MFNKKTQFREINAMTNDFSESDKFRLSNFRESDFRESEAFGN
jgi:hypothetical protein